jgi:polyisoprenoid-binding protein YceI
MQAQPNRNAVLRRRLTALCLVLLTLLLMVSTADAQEMVFRLDTEQSRVEFTLSGILHTVHGTFQLKSGTIRFNSANGKVSGSLVADATSGNSGNTSRDRRMHRQILEDQKYPDIVFTTQHVSGKLAPQGTSQMELQGVMSLHGQQHPMTVAMPVQVSHDQVSADVHFIVPYVKWGLKNPSTFILRVSDKVNIDVHAVGHLRPPALDARRDSVP